MKPLQAFLVGLLAGLFVSCTDDAATRETLRKHGFTDVETTGWSAFGCGQDDTFATDFTATNPRGERVSGTVCCGLLGKGCTLRW